MAGKYRDLYYSVNKYIFSILPDSLYHNLLGWIMYRRFGVRYHWMNIKNPRTFNEKLQWLKSHGDIELKTRLADKYDVRDWVSEKIGQEYLVKLLPLNKEGDVYVTDAGKIEWDLLPQGFALKLSKGSGYNIICKDKNALDKQSVMGKIGRWLKINNYYLSREPQYKGKNKIICEELLEYNIRDYKFFCFNGEPQYLKIDVDRFGNHNANYYSCNWELLELDEVGCTRNPDIKINRPEKFDEMVNVARKLSEEFPFVRVDLYEHGGRIYFGEMTFCPAGGYAPYRPYEWERKLGDMIELDNTVK